MSSAVASSQAPKPDDSAGSGGAGQGSSGATAPTPSNGHAQQATPSSAATSLSPPSMTSIPPHMQQILMSMNKEKLQQMVVRMKTLQAAGETEQSSQEYANLVNTFATFSSADAKPGRRHRKRYYRAAFQSNGSACDSLGRQADDAAAPATSVSEAAKGSDAPTSSSAEAVGVSTVPTSTFSSAQLAALKTQIIAFKMLARNVALPAQLQAALLDPNSAIDEIKEQLEVQVEDLGIDGKVVEAGVNSHLAAEKMKKSEAAPAPERAPSPVDDPSSSVYPYNAYRHPFTYLSKPSLGAEDLTATKQQRLLCQV
ncbi:hypothetical protein L7F22_040837 [Adiantum nelumboides]|nr:hypothetical protein [Adiantum nelumboides]